MDSVYWAGDKAEELNIVRGRKLHIRKEPIINIVTNTQQSLKASRLDLEHKYCILKGEGGFRWNLELGLPTTLTLPAGKRMGEVSLAALLEIGGINRWQGILNLV